MLTMLGDWDTYQFMAKDPTTSLENRMNSVMLRLRRQGRLSGKTYYHLRSSAADVPTSIWVVQGTQAWCPSPLNCILCVLTHVCTVQVSCLLAITNCWPFWLPREELTTICSVHHHPRCAWLRSVWCLLMSCLFSPVYQPPEPSRLPMTVWWMTHLFQTEPASPWMTSAPFSNSAWRPPTWPLKAKCTSSSTSRWWGLLCQ